MLPIFLSFLATATASALPQLGLSQPSSQHGNQQPQCTDGSKLQCCEATFTGSATPVVLAADLLCYDLTPAVVNCIITSAPSDPDTGCVGTPLCCQINELNPVLGLFCSKPPGDCRGKEDPNVPGGCLDVISDRFGNCSESDVNRARGDLGLGPVGDLLESVAGGPVGSTVKQVTGPVGGTVGGALEPVDGVVNGVLGGLARGGGN